MIHNSGLLDVLCADLYNWREIEMAVTNNRSFVSLSIKCSL